MKSNIIKDFLTESQKTLTYKKIFTKQMNELCKVQSKRFHFDKKVIAHCKDYYHYKGLGWCRDALDIDEDEKFPDRISLAFAKFYQIIVDLNYIDNLDFLNEYLQAFEKRGIKITLSPKTIKTKNPKEAINLIEEMSKIQGRICSLADKINIKDSAKAETLGVSSKKDYKKVLDLYDKKSRHTEHNLYSKTIGTTLKTQKAFNNIMYDRY